MRPITIYTTSYCGYCTRAKALLASRGLAFTEIDVTDDGERRVWLVERTGRRTVPQIFIGDTPVGGHDDLVTLLRSGELDRLLGAAADDKSHKAPTT